MEAKSNVSFKAQAMNEEIGKLSTGQKSNREKRAQASRVSLAIDNVANRNGEKHVSKEGGYAKLER